MNHETGGLEPEVLKVYLLFVNLILGSVLIAHNLESLGVPGVSNNLVSHFEVVD